MQPHGGTPGPCKVGGAPRGCHRAPEPGRALHCASSLGFVATVSENRTEEAAAAAKTNSSASTSAGDERATGPGPASDAGPRLRMERSPRCRSRLLLCDDPPAAVGGDEVLYFIKQR